MPQLIFILDLLGTFAFAIVGAEAALRKKFDLFGIFIGGFLTAFAGGTIRELLLGEMPPYFRESAYVLAALLGIAFAILFFRNLPKLEKFILVMDALGLAVFAVIGASRAAGEGLGFFPIIFLATLTAVGGGLMRDALLNQTPRIFYRDFYASPAIFAGIAYALLGVAMLRPSGVYALIAATFLLRLAAVRFGWSLWRPKRIY